MPTTYAVPNGRTAFRAITYTGNGAASSNTTQNITTTFYPDMAWVKGRSEGFYHRLTSTGLTQPNYLAPNATDAEGSVNDQISALASTYFQVKASGSGGTNQSGATYVGWTWNANNGTTVSNTAGTITSTVSANTTSGFSIVTYTGTGTSGQTVGHGLGVKPAFIIVKKRSSTGGWVCWQQYLTGGNEQDRYIYLDLTSASGTTTNYWGTSGITSTTFGVWASGGDNNSSGATFVAYCFAAVAGYSAFGSYTGNGSADGPFTYTGFRPAFVMIKCTSGTGDWCMYDTTRNPSNVVDLQLFANTSQSESSIGSSTFLDILSNGFKNRNTASDKNANGGTYIYMAFAENPFKYANAR